MLRGALFARFFCLLVGASLLWTEPQLTAQTTNAAINGQITDSQGKIVPETQVQAVNIDTNITYPTKTNASGVYAIPALPPGRYRVLVHHDGFKEINKTDIILNIQDILEQNFSLEVGSTSESVTVEGGASTINTTDAAVSTVIDQQFVANIPLNGRSLQSLITLAPGVLAVPGASLGAKGEFSVNGQRTEANYFTVDGVSANTGSTPLYKQAAGTSGSLPGETALGTTQSIIPLDALQEFRATTSTYSAEYGRTPGGQFSFVSRSGTNDWHGSVFYYFRNEALDSTNWFSDALSVQKTPERQGDFGGALGGPVRIPSLYNGKDKTFFFFSYEGLRLTLPAGAATDQYPDTLLRQNAPGVLRPYLNAFPVPNGPEVLDANGNLTGLALFTAAYSNPSSLSAISIRIDHSLSGGMRIFGRYSTSPSSSTVRYQGTDLANLLVTSGDSKSLTLGGSQLLSPHLNNEFRFNYARNNQAFQTPLDTFGGAQPANLGQVPGFSGVSAPQFSQFQFSLFFGASPTWVLQHQQDAQQQWNVTDGITANTGTHSLKLGIDYRRLSTFLRNRQLGEAGFFTSEAGVLQNMTTLARAYSDWLVPPEPVYTNFSAYAQDEWKATRRLSLSFGLRWDINPPPGNDNGLPPYTLNQITDLNRAQLAPAGTPLWRTDYGALAPRVGAAYLLRQSSSRETVVRGGFGLFYGTGNTLASQGFFGVGFSNSLRYTAVPFPLTSTEVVVPPASTTSPYNNGVVAFDPHLKLPYTIQWNVSVEQALGHNQALTLTYVGSSGQRLLFESLLFPTTNVNFSSHNGLTLITGGATSNYNALQVTFHKKLSYGLQSLVSYTWSHSIDDASSNSFSYQLLRADSDFDIRHNFQLALTYNIPGSYSNRLAAAILKDWGVDTRVSARTGLPVDVQDGTTLLPNGNSVNLRPDLVPGVPIYLYRSEYPGGRILNFNAFEPDPSGGQGNLPRNFARDFGWSQADLALRKDFPIAERLQLQFRAEAFNAFNHPNFTNIDNNLGDGPYQIARLSGFGGAKSSPNNSLGGLNPLYQIGGPRSLQLMLKLTF